MAADQSFEDAVAAEGDEAAVVGVGLVVVGIVGGEAVVEICCVVLQETSVSDINAQQSSMRVYNLPAGLYVLQHQYQSSSSNPRAYMFDP